MSPVKPTDPAHKIRITWHGHSCFEIASDQAVVILDPYQEVPGYSPLDLQADLVLASHEHDDHNARNRVALSGREPDLTLEVIDCFHDPEGGKLRGPNKIHILTIDGKRIAHLGDLGHCLTEEETDRLQNLDLMLIPVGGFYTIDADQAAKIVKDTRPDVTIPMHYREAGAGWEVTSGVQPFLDHFDRVFHHDSASFPLGLYQEGILVLKNPIK